LNQIYSLRYGTGAHCPRNRRVWTTQLKSLNLEHGTGTGFKFSEYSGEALLHAIRQALHYYSDDDIWKRIQMNWDGKRFFVEHLWRQNMRNYMRLPGRRETKRQFRI